MKTSWVMLIALNVVMILAFFYVQQDIAARESYWFNPQECHPYIGTSCFTPSLSHGFLFYVLSATCTNPSGCGNASIPGTVTFDWSQLALLVAFVADAVMVLEYTTRRKGAEAAPETKRNPNQSI